jgi:hypothetical protein
MTAQQLDIFDAPSRDELRRQAQAVLDTRGKTFAFGECPADVDTALWGWVELDKAATVLALLDEIERWERNCDHGSHHGDVNAPHHRTCFMCGHQWDEYVDYFEGVRE